MKITVICKSDSTGGAAIVSRRLTGALRELGADARMLVLEKLSDLPYVEKADYPLLEKYSFLAERLQISLANGFSRKNLFKVDTGEFGLPLWDHPLVKDSDAVILNWVNQGMLSLDGVRKIYRMGKKVVWTMHDMWNFTGICHHAMECRHFLKECGNCPYLKKSGHGKDNDLSRKIWKKKDTLYRQAPIQFVAVSNWLAAEARKSSLLKDSDVAVIHNPFKPVRDALYSRGAAEQPVGSRKILFAAASLDNWIKGLDTFRKAIDIFADRYGAYSKPVEVVLAGGVKDPAALQGFALPVSYRGVVAGESALAALYGEADVTANCSFFENLPGTLIEGQAYGAIPVAFDRGGQADIISHQSTGYLAGWDADEEKRASAIADGLAWALSLTPAERDTVRAEMRRSVEEKFSYAAVAAKYMDLLS